MDLRSIDEMIADLTEAQRSRLYVLESRRKNKVRIAFHRLNRIFVRSCRIAAGAIALWFAFYAASAWLDMFTIPFSRYAFADLLRLIGLPCFALWLFSVGMQIAFGDGPKQESEEDAAKRLIKEVSASPNR